MFSKLELLTIVISTQFLLHTLSVSGEWPADLKTQFPFSTPAPINLNSSQATALTGVSSLQLFLRSSDQLNVTNNGRTIIATVDPTTTKTHLTGSIFQNLTYEFRQVFLVFSNNHRDSCGTIIDEKGTPIELAHVFVKSEYSTIEEAKTHRDGIVMVLKRVIVDGVIPNDAFPAFANILAHVQNPNSSVVAPATDFYGWYDQREDYTSYYMHPGSYIDPDSGDGYQCAVITLFAPTLFPSITLSEFKSSFQQLIARDGLPMSNSLPSYEMGPIPVVQGQGIVYHENEPSSMSIQMDMNM